MLKNASVLLLLSLFVVNGLSAQAERPLQILNDYLKDNQEQLGLTAVDIANYEISSELVSTHNKLTHIYLQQSHEGIPVYNAILNANIKPNGEMLSLGNRFVGDLAQKVNTTIPSITTRQAVEATLVHFRLDGTESILLDKQVSDREAIYHKEGLSLEPVRVRLMYQPTPEGDVRLVWNVDLYQLDAQHWWLARVDAVTGEMLDYFDQVVHCEFDRPSIDVDYCPEELPITKHKHTHTAEAFVGSGDSTSAYRVFPLTIESPSHGGRQLLLNPADPIASPFGWHDTNGEDGAEFTITRGNNVHAYHDIFNLNESSGDEPDGGDSLCFDYPLNLSIARPYSELDAATTNLFYWNNLMHDLWLQYGFDEASGNFQELNYGSVSAGSDYVNAEVLDGSGTNNANMGTPADGGNPRMQMYLWGGNLPNFSIDNRVEVTAPNEVAGFYPFLVAGFGGQLSTTEPLEGTVVLVDDNTGTTSDACQPIINGATVTGNIAMIDRGTCQFGVKALAAQQAGAIAVIICNNISDPFEGIGPGTDGAAVNIPVIGIELGQCNQIKVGLPNLEVSIIVQEEPELIVPLPGPSGRDSDFDNGVIAHEYTHGISGRLTGGRNNPGCLSNFEQAGEGWSDWFALAMTTTSANTAEQRRGIGTYVRNQTPNGDGIRQYPYSRDMDIDPHTYADINAEGVSVPHGVGSIWCVAIWDLYWNLVDEYGFDDDLYTGTGGNNIAMQLVLDGLKLQPCNPDFLEARDAILAADEANNDGVNRCLIWETFARRGMGVNAGNNGQENFDKPNTCPPAFRVVKTAVAVADAGDIITYNLEISNGRSNTIAEGVVIDELPVGTTLVEGSSDCNITETDGVLTINVGEAISGATFTCSYQLQTALTPFTFVAFEDRVTGAGNWTFENPITDDSWGIRVNNTFTGLVSLYGQGVDVVADMNLVLEEPVFLSGNNPGLRFYHEYRLENGFDGGVIEVSPDGGDTWVDVGEDNFIENGYNAVLENSDNPLSGRPAFTNASGGFIRTIVDLTAYAGETVLIRFRLGSDTGTALEGWYLDDIALFGNIYSITNTACTDNAGEQLCSSATTILMGEIVSTVDLNQDRLLQLYPNPTTGNLTVSLPEMLSEQVELSITAVDGRLLQRQTYDGFLRETLDLEALPAGVYLLQFRTAENITTRKVIVE